MCTLWNKFKNAFSNNNKKTKGEKLQKPKLTHNNYIFRHLTFIILIAIFQSKTPSLWLCYIKAYWKMFMYGGLLKLLGDLAALVGPISITRIVEYIQQNLSAPSLLTTDAAAAAATAQNGKLSNAINGTDATAPITHSDVMSVVNDAIKTGSNSNYYVPLSAAQYRMSSEAAPMMSALLINENTEIYYPSWPEFVENGWIMALLVLLATLAQGSFSQASTHIVNMIGIRLRTSLQCLVYRKTLLISSSCFTSPNSFDDASAHSNDNENSNGSISTDAHEYYANNDPDDNNGMAIGEQATNATTMTTTPTTAAATMMTNSTTITDDKAKPDSNETVNKSAQHQQQPSHDQTVIDTGTITNLMSEDALNIMFLFYIAHYVWAIPLKVCIQLMYASVDEFVCMCFLCTVSLSNGFSFVCFSIHFDISRIFWSKKLKRKLLYVKCGIWLHWPRQKADHQTGH